MLPNQLQTLLVNGLLVLLAIAPIGCGSAAANVGVVGGALAADGMVTPSKEIQEVYYLGMLDPKEQLPPTVYRVTVHGQASLISLTQFATGWMPAQFVDSLSSSIKFTKTGLQTSAQSSATNASNLMGRRLVLFGPEGFREVPGDQRLVMVMGTDPSEFFNAASEVIGEITGGQAQQTSDILLQYLTTVTSDNLSLQGVQSQMNSDFPGQ